MTRQERHKARRTRLLPNGQPHYVRCYDNGSPGDRYTVVFTGHYRRPGDWWQYLGMSGAPFHPQGVAQHGESEGPIDRPRARHLGKRIPFAALPKDCQTLVRRDYRALWSL